jgi:hypothetical protein
VRIAGVSAQRQGQVENRETVGVLKEQLTNLHITEYWFMCHMTTVRLGTRMFRNSQNSFKAVKTRRFRTFWTISLLKYLIWTEKRSQSMITD